MTHLQRLVLLRNLLPMTTTPTSTLSPRQPTSLPSSRATMSQTPSTDQEPTTTTSPSPTPKATVHLPPAPYTIPPNQKSIFLAGSIEMGSAPDWQSTLSQQLSHLPISILNPRRTAWDSTWTQDISNEPFRTQVEWELDALDRADVIAMFFDRDGKAPISLLELGLYAASGKMVVCCPEGFWRRGNVQVVCQRFRVPLVGTLEELSQGVLERLEQV